ncbi:GntR family transcriptional regulator [Actinomadura sp. NPDC048021]|uniref:GntR family transcriptional regulator n=1 Tax=Actinomadura sp. NPDC048021 TaxID=3155385 RepID=UPI0033D6A8B5
MERRTFREIAADLRQEIVDGEYPTGSTLPPEPELAEKYRVSRSLVNRAMAVLHAEGLVRPQRGRGTQVTWLPPILHTPARYSQASHEGGGEAFAAFTAEIKDLGLEPRHEIGTEEAAPPPGVAEILETTDCLARHRRLFIGDLPVRVSTSWFPTSIAPARLREPVPIRAGGVKSVLASAGYPQSRARERIIMSRPPTDEEAYRLEISPERAVTEITHIGMTSEGRAVEVTVSVLPAHYVEAEYEYSID